MHNNEFLVSIFFSVRNLISHKTMSEKDAADSENKTYLMGSDTFEDESDIEEEEEETNENLLKTRFEIGKLKVVFEKADGNCNENTSSENVL